MDWIVYQGLSLEKLIVNLGYCWRHPLSLSGLRDIGLLDTGFF